LIYIDNKSEAAPPKSDEDVQIEVLSTKVPEAIAALAKEQEVAKQLTQALKMKADREKAEKALKEEKAK
jgi:hypothetical protein